MDCKYGRLSTLHSLVGLVPMVREENLMGPQEYLLSITWPCPPTRTPGLIDCNPFAQKCLLMSFIISKKCPERGAGVPIPVKPSATAVR